jgi:hypothetical protein
MLSVWISGQAERRRLPRVRSVDFDRDFGMAYFDRDRAGEAAISSLRAATDYHRVAGQFREFAKQVTHMAWQRAIERLADTFDTIGTGWDAYDKTAAAPDRHVEGRSDDVSGRRTKDCHLPPHCSGLPRPSRASGTAAVPTGL